MGRGRGINLSSKLVFADQNQPAEFSRMVTWLRVNKIKVVWNGGNGDSISFWIDDPHMFTLLQIKFSSIIMKSYEINME